MNNRQEFSTHYGRFVKEGILKSFLFGALIGLGCAALMALLFWYFDVKAYWVSIIFFVVVTTGSAALLYMAKFRPQTESMAKRLDSFGLDERVVTMAELDGDDSLIARLQRADAQKACTKVNANLIKFAVSVPLMIALVLAVLFTGGMTTVNALSSAGVIRSGKQLIADLTATPATYYTVNYEAVGQGIILGSATQTVEVGESCAAVLAVPGDGYSFVQWSDGSTDPYRKDEAYTSNTTIKAVFEEVDSDVAATNYGDESSNSPLDPEYAQTGDDTHKQHRDNSDPVPKPNENNQQTETSTGVSGTVLDGNTDYADVFASYSAEALEALAADPSISEEARKLISDYLASIDR